MRKIEIEIGGQFVENPEEYLPGVVGAATLLDDLAPRTCEALWSMLPIETRTIHTYRLGQTWRTETNHRLTPSGEAEENIAPEQDVLAPGTLVYFRPGDKFKLLMVYGVASSYPPTTRLSVIGRVDENLQGLINVCRRILYQGPMNVAIRRRG
jgi:hypothetical protein